MSDVVTFYHNPMSRAVMAHSMLEEVGAPYETKLVRFDKGEHKSPEFLAVNPWASCRRSSTAASS